LVALNHFTVPLAITSSPRDQKQKRTAGPRKPACPICTRYAVWNALDSSNDIRIPAENDHYRGAFAAFAIFTIIFAQRALSNGDLFRSAGMRNRGQWASFQVGLIQW
jgi:hypothetical protein